MEHLSLLELNKTITEVLAKNMEPSYWVVAEIGQMQTNQKGHCYLELVEKEDNQIKAKTRATIWSYTYRNLSTWFHGITGQSLKAGMKILFNATVQYHEVYGFSLNIRDIDTQYTLGERAIKRQEIIERLKEDGVFDMNKEIRLPEAPQNIAAISSENAAGFGDFMDQIAGNEFGYDVNIELFHSVMQGNEAEHSMVGALHQVFERIDEFDILVIIRGGGATLDLDCFDSYDLVSHIAQFPIPVVTGIGHERDETITDMVAHTKMKTPTAVAEFIISGLRNFEIQLSEHFQKIANKLKETIIDQTQEIDQLMFRFQRTVQQKLNIQEIALNKMAKNLDHSLQNALHHHKQKLVGFHTSLLRAPNIIEKQLIKINHIEKEVQVLDPENVLRRGFSITTVNGKNINTLDHIEEGTEITTHTCKKRIISTVLTENKRNS